MTRDNNGGVSVLTVELRLRGTDNQFINVDVISDLTIIIGTGTRCLYRPPF